MAAQTAIPLAFNTDDPEALKRDLSRLAAVLHSYFATLTGQPHALAVQSRLKKLPLNSTKAAFGFITPVNLSSESAELVIALPAPDPRNAGLFCVIARQSTLGTIVISSPGCTVNGFDSVEIANAVGFTQVLFDGQNYLTPPGAAWGE